jgi:hypothetical protein
MILTFLRKNNNMQVTTTTTTNNKKFNKRWENHKVIIRSFSGLSFDSYQNIINDFKKTEFFIIKELAILENDFIIKKDPIYKGLIDDLLEESLCLLTLFDFLNQTNLEKINKFLKELEIPDFNIDNMGKSNLLILVVSEIINSLSEKMLNDFRVNYLSLKKKVGLTTDNDDFSLFSSNNGFKNCFLKLASLDHSFMDDKKLGYNLTFHYALCEKSPFYYHLLAHKGEKKISNVKTFFLRKNCYDDDFDDNFGIYDNIHRQFSFNLEGLKLLTR